MLDLETAIHDETRRLHKSIQDAPGRKPRPEDKKAALTLAAKQTNLIKETIRILDLLAAEGTAVAFPEVFQQVCDDMKLVRRRLTACDAGTDIQALQQDIIVTFKEMVEGLKIR
jgi:hypothetical protein